MDKATKSLIKGLTIFGSALLVYTIVHNRDVKNYDRGEIMLKLEEGVRVDSKSLKKGKFGIKAIDKINKKYGILYIKPVFDDILPEDYNGELRRWYHLEFKESVNAEKIVKEYKAKDVDFVVEVAQLDYMYKADRKKKSLLEKIIEEILQIKPAPNDPLWEKQWGMHRIKALETRLEFDKGKKKMPIVAVLDSGVYPHEDLEGMFAKDKNGKVIGWNMIKNNPKWIDDNDHGTHVATIISMVWNNGKGGAGAGHCLIMPVKALNSMGMGTSEDLARGLVWAAEHGAIAINNSWGSRWPAQIIKDAGEYCYKKGVILLAAAGNTGTNSKHYPASFPEFISVAALNPKGDRARFSTWGKDINIAAPGEGIWAGLTKNRYGSLSGTSMATPFVTAAVGELKYYFPKIKPEEIRKLLLDPKSSDKIETDKPIGGKGLNLYKLIKNTKEYFEDKNEKRD